MRIFSSLLITLLILFCTNVIPVLSLEAAKSTLYYCQWIDDLNPASLQKLYSKGTCGGEFSCQDSIMRDRDRHQLQYFFREHSIDLRRGVCHYCKVHDRIYANIYLMTYNWYLEYAATYFLLVKYSCPFSLSTKIESKDFPRTESTDEIHPGTLPDIFYGEHHFSVTSIRYQHKQNVVPVDQSHALDELLGVMYKSDKDLLQLWSATDYKIGAASHFGCAFILLNGVLSNETAGVGGVPNTGDDKVWYLACVFSAERLIESVRGEKIACYGNHVFLMRYPPVGVDLCLFRRKYTPEDDGCDRPCQGYYSFTNLNRLEVPFERKECENTKFCPGSWVGHANPWRTVKDEDIDVDYEHYVILYRNAVNRSIKFKMNENLPDITYAKASGKCVWSEKHRTTVPNINPNITNTTTIATTVTESGMVIDPQNEQNSSLWESTKDLFFIILVSSFVILILLIGFHTRFSSRS